MKHDYAINANFNIGKEGTDNVLKLNGIDITQRLKGYTGSDSININADNEISVADGGVTADKIADGAVTADKIAEGAVTGDKLAEGAIIANNISDNVINGSKLNNNIYRPYYPIWNYANAKLGVIPVYKIKELSITKRQFFSKKR